MKQILKHYFELRIGFSDHGIANILALGAVQIGSRLFEKINTKKSRGSGLN